MSMLQAQCDELRELAEKLDEHERGMDEYVTALREAADAIDRLAAENAKLRKIAREVALPLSIACDMYNIRCCECAFTKSETCPVPMLEEQLKELGIEVTV